MSHAEDRKTASEPAAEAEKVASFLRDLAARAERDPGLATTLAASLSASGLLVSPGATKSRARSASPRVTQSEANTRGKLRVAHAESPDPFALYRSEGESGLRTALEALDLDSLRAIVKARRLDPARVSARWTARERVITLILDQVKARLNHGRAFERV
jgi:hypothetical protein